MLVTLRRLGSLFTGAPASTLKIRKRPAGGIRRLRVEALEGRALMAANLYQDFNEPSPNLGLAAFGVFSMSGSKLDMSNPQTEVGGSVGLGPHAVQNFSDGRIDGNLVVDPTANNSHHNNVVIAPPNSTVIQNLSVTNADAIDASTKLAHLAPTQTVSAITGSTTLTSHTHINVINVGRIDLNGSAALTLKGSSSDYFIINVSGKFSMTGTSAIKLTGGIDTTHVIFNITGTGEQVAFTGKSVGVGTFLAVNRDIAVTGATINGSIIGGMNHQVSIVSGSKVQVNAPHFAPPPEWKLM